MTIDHDEARDETLELFILKSFFIAGLICVNAITGANIVIQYF